ncbi:MAG: ATP-dependent helicase [Cytophagales bacterium]|nr:ATP-dependent helicase [Cytophagales bacterium]
MSIIESKTDNEYQAFFEKELERLNDQQKEAVKQTEGPVLVVAGPGTGKTQILAARIGEILSQGGDISAHNILCLTYTDAGTIAMRKRLLQFIGPTAHNVHIYTFHAFCNQVIQENIGYFSESRELQPVSELELLDIYKGILDDVPRTHFFKRLTGDIYYERRRLANLFNLMKKENFSVEYLTEKLEQCIEELENDPELQYKRKYTDKKSGTVYQKGDINPKKYKKAKEDLETIKYAVSLFEQYEKALRKKRRYDYQDMILWVLKAFQDEESDVLISYQERYQYFLVDEYQDTNGSQNDILDALASYWGEDANVFVVGDDDQSIYRFQGANMSNIVDYYQKYSESIKTIVLQNNYRSTQHILDASKVLIDRNEERLLKKLKQDLPTLTKDLVAMGANAQGDVVPKITAYPNQVHEEADILKRVLALHEQGVRYDDIAIIYRNHNQVESLVKIMESKEIPLNIKKRTNILTLPFVKNIITILHYLHEEHQKPGSIESDSMLFELMHYRNFGVDLRDIAQISYHINYVLKADDRDKEIRWRNVLGDRILLEDIEGLRTIDAIIALDKTLELLTRSAMEDTLQVFFERLINKGKILQLIMSSEERTWLMSVLTTFFDFIKAESARDENMNLSLFLENLDKMIAYEIELPIHQTLSVDDGVHFVTAHSSKGLEFDYVFLLGANNGKWDKKRASGGSYNLPDNVVSDTPNKEQIIEDERRLFYVAMTRAKKALFMSYSDATVEGKALESTRFLSEIMEGTSIETQKVSLSEEEVNTFHYQLLQRDYDGKLELLDRGLIERSLKNFKMSVTNLNKYLRCPLSFYFENVLRVPTARGIHTGFGNAIHYALEHYFENYKNEGELGNSDLLLDYFHKGMDVFHSHFTEKEYADRTAYGDQTLPLYLEEYKNHWKNVNDLELEYAVRNIACEGVPITGKLDKVEVFEGKTVNVIDYKTGNPKNAKDKLKGPDEKNPMGGDYWRQIVFYKVLLDEDTTNRWEMTSGEMSFVQPDKATKKFTSHKIPVKPEDLVLVKEQLVDAYKGIQNHEFNGCGKEDCAWCNFTKDNFNADVLQLISNDQEEQEEEE